MAKDTINIVLIDPLALGRGELFCDQVRANAPIIVKRRRVTAGAVAALSVGFLGTMLRVHLARAVAQDAAIPVRDPASVLLISITNAGNRLVAVGSHGVIIYSDDNGTNWRQAAVPFNQSVTSVAFASPLVGWAGCAQGVILRTSDGGASWITQITGAEVIALMAVAAKADAAAHPNDDSAQRAVYRSGIFTQAGPNKPFLAVLPISEQKVFVFGAYRMTVMTEDGGKSWVDWSLHVGDPISHNIYDVTRMGASIYLVGETGVVLRSDNGGNSFSMLTSPGQGTLLGIFSTPKNTLLTYGVSGNVFRSTDQGQTWSQSNISLAADITTGLTLKSGKIVVASEDGGVYTSMDDGQTFEGIALNEGMSLFDIAQAANEDVVFVGSGGVRVVPASAFN